MAAEKVTTMVLKVDLECEKCYKKVKKVLCKFPQIRDQVYDEKQGTVTIKVVCCSPEKIRDKLCYKGGGSIKSIEIKEDKPAKGEAEKKKDADKPKAEADKKKDADKPKAEGEKKDADKPKADQGDKKKDAGKPKAEGEKKKDGDKAPKAEGEKKKDGDKAPKADGEKKKDGDKAPKADGEKKKDGDKAPKASDPGKPAAGDVAVAGYPPQAYAAGVVPFYDGQPGAPCFHGYGGVPVYGAPVVVYDGYYGRPVYDSYGGNRPCYVNRCDQYFSEDNTAGCSMM